MSVYKKLNTARIELQGKKLSKSGNNKFAGYQYFELGDFMPTVNEIFNNLGLCGVVSFGSEIATLTITDVEDSSSLTITSPMAEANLKGCHPIQNLGAVETYTRRYLWVTAMEIVEHDALDSSEPQKPVTKLPELKSVQLSDFDEDQQQSLKRVAQDMNQAVKDEAVIDAYSLGQTLTNDEKNAIWPLLDSQTRSALKKYSATQQHKEAA